MIDLDAVLTAARVLPVVVIDDAGTAAPMAKALLAGGIACAEITLRTPAGIDAIREAAAVPGFTVGAGTVTTPGQLEAAVGAGARFVVSPGLDERVITRSAELGVPAVPGIATATEAQHAVRLGLRLLKLFPADLLGGPAFVRALGGPFPDLRFVPSGGIDAGTLADYLALDAVAAASGSWITPRRALRQGDFGAITRAAHAVAQDHG